MKSLLKIIGAVVVLAAVALAAGKFFPDKVYMAKSAVFELFSGESPKLEEMENIKTEELGIERLLEMGASENDSLMLINVDNPLPEDYEPELAALGDGEVFINSCAADAYGEIKAAVREKFGNALYIMSAFRTDEEQAAAAESEGDLAAAVGASEHQAGLALDVYVKYFAGEGFLKSPEGQFVNSNCSDYGFIIRYPAYGEAVTGIAFEPWHIRYVGLPHSEIIQNEKLTLEEYILSLEVGEFYSYDEYIITRQEDGESFAVPAGLREIVVSKDNTGCAIITGKK